MDDVSAKMRQYDAGATSTDMRSLLGGLLTLDWKQALVARGYGCFMTVGAFSTPITGGGAGTIIDLDQPEGIISVPLGTTLCPLRLAIDAQMPLTTADSDEQELLIAVDRTARWAGDGTFTAESVFNMRTDLTGTIAPVTGASAFSADTTDPVLDVELARKVMVADLQGVAANMLKSELFLVYEPLVPPLIVGPAMIVLYWGGTIAMTAFAECSFLAFPSNLVTGLS